MNTSINNSTPIKSENNMNSISTNFNQKIESRIIPQIKKNSMNLNTSVEKKNSNNMISKPIHKNSLSLRTSSPLNKNPAIENQSIDQILDIRKHLSNYYEYKSNLKKEQEYQ